jgi:hypothetical protein
MDIIGHIFIVGVDKAFFMIRSSDSPLEFPLIRIMLLYKWIPFYIHNAEFMQKRHEKKHVKLKTQQSVPHLLHI